jgi:hypothetical protein
MRVIVVIGIGDDAEEPRCALDQEPVVLEHHRSPSGWAAL